jgi:DNA-binding transcriptional LysR family regulator
MSESPLTATLLMNIGALHLTQLRLVDALARKGTLTEAAEEIGVTQGAASHALGRLRRGLEDPIFVRTAEGMRPTPYGARLAAAVRDALHVLRGGLERDAEFVPGKSRRAFNVFMTDSSQMLYLPRLLARLSAEAPGVSLRVRPFAEKAQQMLESGEVDLAMGTFTTLTTGCIQKRLYRERYVCVVRKDHPAFEHGMTAEAFCNVPHARTDAGGFVHEIHDRWLARQKVHRVVKLHVPHFLVLPMVIARSDLLAVMSSRTARTFADIVPLMIMPLPMKVPAFDIRLFWHERFHREPGNRWFRGLFIDLFSD